MRQVGCLLVCAAMLKIPHLAGWRKAGPLRPGRTPAFWRCAVFGADMLPQVSASPAISPSQRRPSANSLEAQLSLGKRAAGATGTNSMGQYASHILDTMTEIPVLDRFVSSRSDWLSLQHHGQSMSHCFGRASSSVSGINKQHRSGSCFMSRGLPALHDSGNSQSKCFPSHPQLHLNNCAKQTFSDSCKV